MNIVFILITIIILWDTHTHFKKLCENLSKRLLKRKREWERRCCETGLLQSHYYYVLTVLCCGARCAERRRIGIYMLSIIIYIYIYMVKYGHSDAHRDDILFAYYKIFILMSHKHTMCMFSAMGTMVDNRHASALMWTNHIFSYIYLYGIYYINGITVQSLELWHVCMRSAEANSPQWHWCYGNLLYFILCVWVPYIIIYYIYYIVYNIQKYAYFEMYVYIHIIIYR